MELWKKGATYPANGIRDPNWAFHCIINLPIMAVNSYNKYLVKLLRLQINDLRVYYAFVNSNVLIGDHIQSLFKVNNNDKLVPARSMSQITNVQKPEGYLVKESLSTKIVTWGTFVGALLPNRNFNISVS